MGGSSCFLPSRGVLLGGGGGVPKMEHRLRPKLSVGQGPGGADGVTGVG